MSKLVITLKLASVEHINYRCSWCYFGKQSEDKCPHDHCPRDNQNKLLCGSNNRWILEKKEFMQNSYF
jgi:hypothetical protein